MKIIIDIPKEFEDDYKGDKFEDLFSRILCDIQKGVVCGNYEKETVEIFLKAFKESKSVEKECDDCAGCTSWKCDCYNIRNKAIDDFFNELEKYEEDDWLKLKMSSIYQIAEQLKEMI